MSAKNHIILRVEGMTWDGCPRHVTAALILIKAREADQVQVVSWNGSLAVVGATPAVGESDLIDAIKKSGCRAGRGSASRYRCARWGLPLLLTAPASRSNSLTRLQYLARTSPVNASRQPSRAALHDSGPVWVASPSLFDAYIHYTSPVLTGAPGE